MSVPTGARQWQLAEIMVLAPLLFYLLFCWLAPYFIAKKVLAERLRDWLEAALAQTSPVRMETVDVALRHHGRVDLYLQDVEFEPPNPAFALPWLQIDTVRASAPFYELWGGIRPTAEIQIRGPLLRWQSEPNGKFNLAGLQLTASKDLPFSGFDVGDVTFLLQHGRILIDDAANSGITGEAAINGALAIHTIGSDYATAREVVIDATFNEPDNHAPRRAALALKHGTWNYETAPLTPSYELELTAVPLRLLAGLYPALPALPPELTLSGIAREDGGKLEFNGKISGALAAERELNITLRRERTPGWSNFLVEVTTDTKQLLARFSWAAAEMPGAALWTIFLPPLMAPDKLITLPTAAAAATDTAKNTAAVNGAKVGGGTNSPLEIFIPSLNLTAKSWRDYPVFGANLRAFFPAARITIGELTLNTFRFSNVVFDVLPTANATVNLAAECNIAGGKAVLVAQELPLTGGAPQSFYISLDVPTLGDTLLYFSGLLPPPFQISPLRGRGEATLKYVRKDDQDSLILQLALSEVVIPTAPAGALWQAIVGLNGGIIEVENMTRRAAPAGAAPLPPLPLPAEPTEPIALTTLFATYQIDADDVDALTFFEAQSPQLGQLRGQGAENRDGAFHLTMTITDAPSALFTDLSPAVAQAARAIMTTVGLRVEGRADGVNGTVERRYLQDIFKQWLAQTSAQ